MIFIIDAHLPKSLVQIIEKHGQEAIHTSSLDQGNASSDVIIIELAEEKKRL